MCTMPGARQNHRERRARRIVRIVDRRNNDRPRHFGTANLPESQKLVGSSNYGQWKFGMKNLLVECGLWTPGEEHIADDDIEVAARALAKINLNVMPEVYPFVSKCNTGRQAWDALKAAFEDDGYSRRYALKRRLYNTYYKDFKTMSEYVSAIKTLGQTLDDIGAPVPDEEVANALLNGLPSAFEPMMMAVEHSVRTLTTELVVTKLMTIEASGKLEDENSALFSRSHSSSNSASSSSGLQCFYCRKPGHRKYDCPLLKKKNKTADPKPQGKHSRKFHQKNMACKCEQNDEDSTDEDEDSEPEQTMFCHNCDTSEKLDGDKEFCLLVGASTQHCGKQGEVNKWIVDSGASRHMCNSPVMFESLEDTKTTITVADDRTMTCDGKGIVKLKIGENHGTMKDVLLVNSLGHNLLSVSQLTDNNFLVVFDKDLCTIKKKDGSQKPIIARRSGNLYVMDALIESANLARKDATLDVWHRRLGHPNDTSLKKILASKGIKVNTKEEVSTCETCIQGKMSKSAFPLSSSRAENCLDLVHSDLMGPMKVQSFSGARFVLTFTDDYSRKTFAYVLKKKSDAFAKFKEFKNLVEKQTGQTIKCLRTDNGGEYMDGEFESFLKDCGIVHQSTVPHNPEQNGRAERMNRTIMDKARC